MTETIDIDSLCTAVTSACRIDIAEDEDTKQDSNNDHLLYPLLVGNYYNHQKEVASWMRVQEKKRPNGFRGGIISLTMGLGKTLLALGYALRHYRNTPTLIVVPKSVLVEWKTNGIDKFFGNDQDIKIIFFHKDLNKNIETIRLEDVANCQLVITTYSMCAQACLWGRYHLPIEERGGGKLFPRRRGIGLLYNVFWNRIIFDESHKACNPTTKTFAYMMTLSGKYKWCMSGTPIVNYDTDIWAQLRLCGYDVINTLREWKVQKNVVFNDKLRQSVFVMDYTQAVHVTLPPLHNHEVIFELKGEFRELYDELRGEVKKSLNELSEQPTAPVYAHMFAMLTRLRQCVIAPYIISPFAKRRPRPSIRPSENEEGGGGVADLGRFLTLDKRAYGIHAPKLMKTVEILRDTLGTKTIVFSMFASALDLLRECIETNLGVKVIQIDGGVKDKPSVVQRFKTSPDVNILLATYKVGCEGLNITEATNCILLEPWWNNATLNQAKSRLWRTGQKLPVHVYNLIVKDTVEDKIRDICTRKDELIDSYLSNEATPRNGQKKVVLTKKVLRQLLN
jgi:SNF2 family DNA or RNA helicase